MTSIRYIDLTFRSGGAVITALIISFLLGPRVIAWLRSKQGEGQPIREDGPEGHLLTKKGTPTMGGFLMLLAIMAMYWDAGTTDIPTLLAHKFPAGWQNWLFLAFLASFAVKLPMWPVHTWLPDAHVEAPTAGSVVLAAILLKMGGYGFLRFSLPMFPVATDTFAPLIFAMSIVAIVVIKSAVAGCSSPSPARWRRSASVAHSSARTKSSTSTNMRTVLPIVTSVCGWFSPSVASRIESAVS